MAKRTTQQPPQREMSQEELDSLLEKQSQNEAWRYGSDPASTIQRQRQIKRDDSGEDPYSYMQGQEAVRQPDGPTPDAPEAVLPSKNWRVPQIPRPSVLDQITSAPQFQEKLNAWDQGAPIVPRFGAPLPMDQLLQSQAQRNAYIDQSGNVFPINRQTGDTANYASHVITPEGVKQIDYRDPNMQTTAFDPNQRQSTGFLPEAGMGAGDVLMQPAYGIANLLNSDKGKVYGGPDEYYRGRENEGMGRTVGNLAMGTALTAGAGAAGTNLLRLSPEIVGPAVAGLFTASQELNPTAKGQQSWGTFGTKVLANTAAAAALGRMQRNPFEGVASAKEAAKVLGKVAAQDIIVGGVAPEIATILAESVFDHKPVDWGNSALRITATGLLNGAVSAGANFWSARRYVNDATKQTPGLTAQAKEAYVLSNIRPPEPGEVQYREVPVLDDNGAPVTNANGKGAAMQLDPALREVVKNTAVDVLANPQAQEAITAASGKAFSKDPLISLLFTNPGALEKGKKYAGPVDPGFSPENLSTIYKAIAGLPSTGRTPREMTEMVMQVYTGKKPMPAAVEQFTTGHRPGSNPESVQVDSYAPFHDNIHQAQMLGTPVQPEQALVEQLERRAVFGQAFGDVPRITEAFASMVDYYKKVGIPIKFKKGVDASNPAAQKQWLEEQYNNMFSKKFFDIISGEPGMVDKYVAEAKKIDGTNKEIETTAQVEKEKAKAKKADGAKPSIESAPLPEPIPQFSPEPDVPPSTPSEPIPVQPVPGEQVVAPTSDVAPRAVAQPNKAPTPVRPPTTPAAQQRDWGLLPRAFWQYRAAKNVQTLSQAEESFNSMIDMITKAFGPESVRLTRRGNYRISTPMSLLRELPFDDVQRGFLEKMQLAPVDAVKDVASILKDDAGTDLTIKPNIFSKLVENDVFRAKKLTAKDKRILRSLGFFINVHNRPTTTSGIGSVVKEGDTYTYSLSPSFREEVRQAAALVGDPILGLSAPIDAGQAASVPVVPVEPVAADMPVVTPAAPQGVLLPRLQKLADAITKKFGPEAINVTPDGRIETDLPLARLQSVPLGKVERAALQWARDEGGRTIIEPPPVDTPAELPPVVSAPEQPASVAAEAVKGATKVLAETKMAQTRLDKVTESNFLSDLMQGDEIAAPKLTEEHRGMLRGLGFDFEGNNPVTTPGVGTVTGSGRNRTISIDPEFKASAREALPKTDTQPEVDTPELVNDLPVQQVEADPESGTTESGDTGMTVQSKQDRSARKKAEAALLPETVNASIAKKAEEAGIEVEDLGDGIYKLNATPEEIVQKLEPKLTKKEKARYKLAGKSDNSITIYGSAAAAANIGAAEAIDDLDTDKDGKVAGVDVNTWKAIFTAGAVGATAMTVGRGGWFMPRNGAAEVADKSDLYIDPRMEKMAALRVDPEEVPAEIARMKQELKKWDEGIASDLFTKSTRSIEPLAQLAERNTKIREIAEAHNDAMYDGGTIARDVEDGIKEATAGLNNQKKNELAKAIIAADAEGTRIANSDLSPYEIDQAFTRLNSDEYIVKVLLKGNAKLLPNFRALRKSVDAVTKLQYLSDASKRAEVRISDMQSLLDNEQAFLKLETEYKKIRSERPRKKRNATPQQARAVKKEQKAYDNQHALIMSTYKSTKAARKAIQNAYANIDMSARKMYIPRWDWVKDVHTKGSGIGVQFKPKPDEMMGDISVEEDGPTRVYFKNEKEREKYIIGLTAEQKVGMEMIDPTSHAPRPPLREQLRKAVYEAAARGNDILFKNEVAAAIKQVKAMPDSKADEQALSDLLDMDIAKTPIDKLLHYIDRVGKSWAPLHTKRWDFDGWQPPPGKEWEMVEYNLGKNMKKGMGLLERSYILQTANKQMTEIAQSALYGKYWQWLQKYKQEMFESAGHQLGQLARITGSASQAISGAALALNLSSGIRNTLGGLTAIPATYLDSGMLSGVKGMGNVIGNIFSKSPEVKQVISKLEQAGFFDHTSIELWSNMPFLPKDLSDNLLIISHVTERELRKLAATISATDYLAAYPMPKDANAQVAHLRDARRHAQQFTNTALGDFTSQASRSAAERMITNAGGKPLLALMSPWFNEMGLFQRLAGKVFTSDAQKRKLLPILSYISIGILTGGTGALPWISDAIALTEGAMDKYDDWFGDKGGKNTSASAAEKVQLGLRSWLKEKGWSDDNVDKLIESVESGAVSAATDTNLGRNASILDALDGIFVSFWKDLFDRIDKAGPDNWGMKAVEQVSRTSPFLGRVISGSRQLSSGKAIDHKTGDPTFYVRDGKPVYEDYGMGSFLKESLTGKPLSKARASNAQFSDKIPLVSPTQRTEYAENLVGTEGVKVAQKGAARRAIEDNAYEVRTTILNQMKKDPKYRAGIKNSTKMMEDFFKDTKEVERLRAASGSDVDYATWKKAAMDAVRKYYESLAVGDGLEGFLKKKGVATTVGNPWQTKVISRPFNEQGYWYALKSLKSKVKKGEKEQ